MLEAIEVDQHQRARDLIDVGAKTLMKRIAVRKRCKRITMGEMLEPALSRLPAGDVADQGSKHWSARLEPHRQRQFDWKLAPIRVKSKNLDGTPGETCAAGLHRTRQACVVRRSMANGNDIERAFRWPVRGVAEELSLQCSKIRLGYQAPRKSPR